MSLTVSAIIQSEIRAVVTDSLASPADNTTTYDSASSTDTYNAASAVPVSFQSPFTVTLSSGTATLDLTAIPRVGGGTFDATGLRIQAIRFEASAGNANTIAISNGASNPYRLNATTTAWSDTLVAGQVAQHELKNAGDVVGSSHKTIDFAGTGAQTMLVHLLVG